MPDPTPESRTATVAAGVTPSEKRAINLVATVDGKTISDLLRPAVEKIVARGHELSARLRDMEKVA